MQFLIDVKQKAAEFAEQNAATLLTAGGVVGTVATAVLAGRAGYKTGQVVLHKKIEVLAEELDENNSEENPYLKVDSQSVAKKDVALAVIVDYIPPFITGTATVTAIIMANRVSAQKAAALAAAYGLAERNLSEYKEKVAEKLTGPKRTAIDDELAQESVNKTPGHDKVVIIEGEVLCLDKPGGRYFNSTMETIRQAANATNAEVYNHGFALLSFFYNELGLDETTWSESVGFTTENILELTFTTTTAPGNRPCLVFDFARLPTADYNPKHF